MQVLEDAVKSITIVGCGVMGSRLISALMKKGIKPVIVDLNRSAAEKFVLEGAEYAPSLSEAEWTDAVLLNLPHHGIASKVIKDCEKEKLRGRMLIDTTTSTVSEVKDMAAIAAECGMDYLDAKIMCYPGDIATENGGLVYAGDRKVYDALEDSVLSAFGKHVYLGDNVIIASVTDTGVCNVHFGAIGSLLESAAFCIRSGCDIETFIAQIRTFLSPMFEGNLRAFASELRNYDGKFEDATECTLDIEATAAGTLSRAIRDSGVETPVGDTLYSLFMRGVNAGNGKKNVVSVINEIIEK